MHSIVHISPPDLVQHQLNTYPKRLEEERAKKGTDAYDIKAVSFLRDQLWRINEKEKDSEQIKSENYVNTCGHYDYRF